MNMKEFLLNQETLKGFTEWSKRLENQQVYNNDQRNDLENMNESNQHSSSCLTL